MSDLSFLLTTIAAAILLRLFVVSFARIKGRSMLPALCDRDWTLVWRLTYLFGHPRRFDVVICRFPGRRSRRFPFMPQSFVKRVIGLPGETLEVIDGVLHINGQSTPEPFLDASHTRFFRSRAPVTLGPDEYFVMGDNRDASNDSRRVGPLKRRAIVGRVVQVLLPPGRFRRVR